MYLSVLVCEIHMYTYTGSLENMHVCVYLQICIYVCICIYACMYVFMYIHIWVYIYTRTHTHAYEARAATQVYI